MSYLMCDYGGRKELRMAAALEKVIELFRSQEWEFDLDEENKLLRSVIEGDNGEWRIVLSASEEDQVCLMLSILPHKCPPHRRSACAELLSRINYALRVGCFEMDFDTGRINFKTSYPFAEGQLDDELLKKVVLFNINFMDKYLPAVMAVIYAGTSPAKAQASVEKKKKPSKQNSRRVSSRRRFSNN